MSRSIDHPGVRCSRRAASTHPNRSLDLLASPMLTARRLCFVEGSTRGAAVRGFGDLEAAIMDRLWARGESATVRDVLDDLAPTRTLAYTTVLTVVDNLFKKGWLRREPDGRAYRYTPTLTREEYGARQLRHALDGAGDPAEVLVRFVGQMNDDETAALRRALDAYERDAGR